MSVGYSPFAYQDYKEFLRTIIEQRRGNLKAIAEAAGCQRPYLSRVLSDKVQLLPEHIYNISVYLQHRPEETRYLSLMLELARTSQQKHREYLRQQMREMKALEEKSRKQADKDEEPKISEQNSLRYYANWLNQIIHIAVSIPELQTEVALANRFGISLAAIGEALRFLAQINFVELRNGRWRWLSGHFHTPATSPLTRILQSSLKNLAMNSAYQNKPDSVHFSVVQSMAREDFFLLREELLQFVQHYNQIASPSKPEEVIVFNCDFFIP